MASKMSRLFDSVSIKAIVDGVPVKVTTKETPADFSWNATRKVVIASKELKTSATIDKDTPQERTFRGKDKDGSEIAEHLAPADAKKAETK